MALTDHYLSQVFQQLDALGYWPKAFIDLKRIAEGPQRDMYIAAGKQYIDERRGDVEFNDSYTKIRKIQWPVQ